MNETPLTAQDIEREFSDITEMIERGEAELTPDVKEYLHDFMQIIMRKVEKGMDVTKKDTRFLEDVKAWIMLPEKWRNVWPSIEEMKDNDEVEEANKRGITLGQWTDLLDMMEGRNLSKDYIDAEFDFANGRIICKGFLDVRFPEVKKLPKNLTVKRTLFLEDSGLTSLPEGLEVYESIGLQNTAITEWPQEIKRVRGNLILAGSKIKKLPDGLKVVGKLNLDGCQIETLPVGLNVNGNLYLRDTKIKNLPMSLFVINLFLSKNVPKQLKRDAEKLKENGNIMGDIIYKEQNEE